MHYKRLYITMCALCSLIWADTYISNQTLYFDKMKILQDDANLM